jgi:hypothetical protein
MATGTTLSQQTVTGLALFGVGWLICVASFAFDPLACFEASDDDDGGCEGIGAWHCLPHCAAHAAASGASLACIISIPPPFLRTDEDDLPDGKTEDDLSDYLAALSLAMTLRLGGWAIAAIGASQLPAGKLGLGCGVSTATASAILVFSTIEGDELNTLGSPVTWFVPGARILAMCLLALAFIQHRSDGAASGGGGGGALMAQYQPS